MSAPRPTRLFHITAIANVPQICAAGGILSKNAGATAGIRYQNIAHAQIQSTRAARAVPDPPGGLLHDFVPFYFAPRSPMLCAINNGKVAGCDWRQADIVHFETTVEAVVAARLPFVFYDRNASLQYSVPHTDLEHLDTAVAWDLLTEPPTLDGFCKFWQNRADNHRYVARMEQRQAEFLAKNRVPLEVFTRLGVMNAQKQASLQSLLDAAGVRLRVDVKNDWYF